MIFGDMKKGNRFTPVALYLSTCQTPIPAPKRESAIWVKTGNIYIFLRPQLTLDSQFFASFHKTENGKKPFQKALSFRAKKHPYNLIKIKKKLWKPH